MDQFIFLEMNCQNQLIQGDFLEKFQNEPFSFFSAQQSACSFLLICIAACEVQYIRGSPSSTTVPGLSPVKLCKVTVSVGCYLVKCAGCNVWPPL